MLSSISFTFRRFPLFCSFFFFNDTATTEIYTLSLHDALPICSKPSSAKLFGSWTCLTGRRICEPFPVCREIGWRDRKSTRLNSSHLVISYAVFCLKKKKQYQQQGTSESRHSALRHRHRSDHPT